MATKTVVCGVVGNDGSRDADGNRWEFGLDGWDSADVDVSVSQVTGRHGGVTTGRWVRARTVAVKVTVRCLNEAGMYAAYDKLTQSMPGLYGSGTLEVYEPTPKFLSVTQGGRPMVRDPKNFSVSGTLVLLAEYPFKQALTGATESIAAGTSESFTAFGGEAAEWTATLTSSGSVSLSAGGLTLSTGGVSLPSGTVLDSLARTVTGPSGENLYGSLVGSSEWPAVVPGSNTFVNAGSAGVELAYFPTFA